MPPWLRYYLCFGNTEVANQCHQPDNSTTTQGILINDPQIIQQN